MKTVLTISGSDTYSGGGLQADLRTMAALNVESQQLLTCIVTANTQKAGIQIYSMSEDAINEQWNSLDFSKIDVIKVGMLADLKIARIIFKKVKDLSIPIVLDPVLALKETDVLHMDDNVHFFNTQFLPISFLTTPNLEEAALLSGIHPIDSMDKMKQAAYKIHQTGVKHVVIKGGQRLAGSKACDLWYNGQDYVEFEAPLILKNTVNGAGCTFASAISCYCANGLSVSESISNGKKFVHEAINQGIVCLPTLGNVRQINQP